MIIFTSVKNTVPSPGLVLRCGSEASGRYLRITHVFENCAYGMPVGDAAEVRMARKPQRLDLTDLTQLVAESGSVWGRIALPNALSEIPEKDSRRWQVLEHTWTLIKPLVKAFKNERNLDRSAFTRLIHQRAELVLVSEVTLRKILLRYYYFGGVKSALLPIPPGPKPTNDPPLNNTETSPPVVKVPARRGRKSVNTQRLGRNEFVVSEEDIDEMISRYRLERKRDGHSLSTIHENYLKHEFRNRHPSVFNEYINGKIQIPVTLRQFRYYVIESNLYRDIETLADGVTVPARSSGLNAIGPGEITEIDSTGGRIHLVEDGNPSKCIGKPTIYLAIDRWSRYVLAVYMSLRPPSYEELRYLLLISFTSRTDRFSEIGVEIDEVRWPRGRLSACICEDRGSENICESARHAIAEDLKIELQILPPGCPDGKAIVERLIRTLKKRMASNKGAYAARPIDRDTKNLARKAAFAAASSLTEAFRILIEIVVDHNNRPHRTLRRNRILSQASVEPTPQAAYLWGLENITGVPVPPLSDEDYQRILLSTDSASIARGEVIYRGHNYIPANREAVALVRESGSRRRAITVRVDKSQRWDLYVSSTRRNWAKFHIKESSANEIRGISLDEEEMLSGSNAALWARSEHEATRSRIATSLAKKHTSKQSAKPMRLASDQQRTRVHDTNQVKRSLTNSGPQKGAKNRSSTKNQSNWREIEQRENDELLRAMRARRKIK
jgi:putative transposase